MKGPRWRSGAAQWERGKGEAGHGRRKEPHHPMLLCSLVQLNLCFFKGEAARRLSSNPRDRQGSVFSSHTFPLVSEVLVITGLCLSQQRVPEKVKGPHLRKCPLKQGQAEGRLNVNVSEPPCHRRKLSRLSFGLMLCKHRLTVSFQNSQEVLLSQVQRQGEVSAAGERPGVELLALPRLKPGPVGLHREKLAAQPLTVYTTQKTEQSPSNLRRVVVRKQELKN